MVPPVVRRLLLPPRLTPARSAGDLRAAAQLRAVVAVVAGVGIVASYLSLRDAPRIERDVLTLDTVAGVVVVALDVALALLFLRRRTGAYAVVQPICVLLEMGCIVVGAEVFDIPTTFSVIVAALLWLNRMDSYAAGLTCALGYLGMQSAVFGLESAGAFRHGLVWAAEASAAPGGSGVLSPLVQLFWFTFAMFAGANFYATRLRETEHELHSVQRGYAEVLEDAQPGRLAGEALNGVYLLGDLLGHGGMGEVYAATRQDDGRGSCVKLLHRHLSHVPSARARFLREGDITARLPRASAPEIFERGTTADGRDYLVMERLEGEDLGAVLRRRGRLPQDETVRIARGIAEALAPAHAMGVVHRDLKPANVFLETRGARVRLLDFGVARLEEQGTALTQPLALLGTPGYLAPEQARGAPAEIGPHTDVFALGAIVYRALTGQAAFAARHPTSAIFEANFVDPPPASALAPDLGPAIDSVLALALAKRPADRYPTPAAFADDLARAVQGQLDEAVQARAAALARAGAPRTLTEG